MAKEPTSGGSGGGSVGLSGGSLLALYLAVMTALIGAFFLLRRKFRAEEGTKPAAAVAARAVAAPAAAAAAGGAAARRAAGGRPARGALDRMRRDLEERKGGAADADAADDELNGGAESGDEGLEDGAPLDRAAMREREKAAARAAREQMRAAQEAGDAARKKKDDAYADKRAAREAEREAAAAELARQEAERAAEQAKKDAAEFDQWKDMFTVSASGVAAADDEAESQEQLEEFVRHIQKRKVVVLDEVAALFKIKTPDVISRIQAMEAAGRLTGVLDDRGKFLSIEPAELDAVARWINRRGRVTIADLVTESNKLIDLNGEETQEQLVIDDEDDSKAA